MGVSCSRVGCMRHEYACWWCLHATGKRLLGIAKLENRLRRLMALPLLHQTQPSRLRRWGISAFRACSIISSSIKNSPDLMGARTERGCEIAQTNKPGRTPLHVFAHHHTRSSTVADPQSRCRDGAQRAQEFCGPPSSQVAVRPRLPPTRSRRPGVGLAHERTNRIVEFKASVLIGFDFSFFRVMQQDHHS